MKKSFLIFIFLFSIGLSSLSANGYICVLGYPESGGFWLDISLNDMLSTLDQRGVIRSDPHLKRLSYSAVQLGLEKLDKSQNYLIVIVRNYRECMMLRYLENPEMSLDVLKREYQVLSESAADLTVGANYAANLKWYDEWDEGKRFLVYYEDLIQYPEATFKALIRLLGKDETLVDQFMDHFIEKRKLAFGDPRELELLNKGLLYHTSLMPKEKILAVDEFMKTKYPAYWEKYLCRYEYQEVSP